ncbi:MAG: FG-GAP-like repeat-containing protein, partial [Planctomycetota bacterium]
SNTLQVLHNDGAGNFASAGAVSTGAGSQPSSIDAVPIFSEDPTLAGVLDFAVSLKGSGAIGIFYNPGSGLPYAFPIFTLPGGLFPTGVRGVDIDNNRFFDLVAANSGDGTVSVYMRQPSDPKSGAVPGFDDPITLAVGEDPIGTAAADLDGDGLVDITTVNGLSNSVSVLLNRTAGTAATFAPAVTLPTGGAPASIVVGDFDLDTAPGDAPDLDIALTARATTAPDAPRVIKIIRNDRANGVLVLAPDADIAVDGAPKIVVAEELDATPGADLLALNLTGALGFNGGVSAKAQVLPSVVRPRCTPGDIDCNGVVNGADLAALLSAWGQAGGAADLNADGVVDGADLATLLGNWG